MTRHAKLALRIGLAFVFLYASISALITPSDWTYFIPDWMQKLPPGADLQLKMHAFFELGLGLWLLVGWKGFWAAVIAAFDLTMITLVNISILSVVFRDVGLIFAAVALAFLYHEQLKK